MEDLDDPFGGSVAGFPLGHADRLERNLPINHLVASDGVGDKVADRVIEGRRVPIEELGRGLHPLVADLLIDNRERAGADPILGFQ